MANTGNSRLFFESTPVIKELSKVCADNDKIDPQLYAKYDVKRGLRDLDGKGVLTGLTNIAEVKAYTIDDNEIVPCPGKLYYRGYDIEDLVQGFGKEHRFGFEEIAYLLMFGKLPDMHSLESFKKQIEYYRGLPTNFVRDVILKAPSRDMINTLSRSILTLYSYDDSADDTSIENVLRQCIALLAVMPMLAVYGYHAYQNYNQNKSLIIHQPKEGLSSAETLLRLLRPDKKYTQLEAKVLDICLVLHADHGGGNNSAFTTRVVTSTLTDTYSAISAALASLKGPRHGGANVKVAGMMDYLKEHIKDWKDDDEIMHQLNMILSHRCYDRQGLIYGIGHAVYTISDPRTEILRSFVGKLAKEKDKEDELALYLSVERLAPSAISAKRKMYRANMCANVDFFSGFVYTTLGIPRELFTPLFAVARMAGWSAHRLEELAAGSKIIRPAYKSVQHHVPYIPMSEREGTGKAGKA